MAFKLTPVSELGELPPPAWLIEGLIEQNVFGVLYGASGEGKSFIALDWALSIASGLPWQGRTVKAGPVVYIVAEGSRNITKRVDAWCIGKNRERPDDMYVLMQPVQLRDADQVTALISTIDRRNLMPRLIVIDTLARCFLGGDENSSTDMGFFVEACNEIQVVTGATVLVIHHTGKPRGKKAGSERGSYALRGAADVMIRAYRLSGAIHIAVDKQKDDEAAADICLRLKPVVVAIDQVSGVDITSCVLVPVEGSTVTKASSIVGEGPLKTLRALVGMPEHKAQSGVWRKAIPTANGDTIAEKTFQNHRKRLLENELVSPIEGQDACYQVTSSGIATANGLPFYGHPLQLTGAATANTPLGVAGGTGEAGQAAELSQQEIDEFLESISGPDEPDDEQDSGEVKH